MNITPSPNPDPSPPALLSKLDAPRQEAFIEVWKGLLAHLRRIRFDVVGPEWTLEIICPLGGVSSQYQSRFSRFKTDVGHYHTLPLRIKLPPGTAPTTSRPYRTDPALFLSRGHHTSLISCGSADQARDFWMKFSSRFGA